jgi:hypothetical protein
MGRTVTHHQQHQQDSGSGSSHGGGMAAAAATPGLPFPAAWGELSAAAAAEATRIPPGLALVASADLPRITPRQLAEVWALSTACTADAHAQGNASTGRISD